MEGKLPDVGPMTSLRPCPADLRCCIATTYDRYCYYLLLIVIIITVHLIVVVGVIVVAIYRCYHCSFEDFGVHSKAQPGWLSWDGFPSRLCFLRVIAGMVVASSD